MRAHNFDHWLCLPYSIAITIWGCFLFVFWRQKSSIFAYRWGVLDYEIEETERPLFIGKYTYDDSSNEVRKYYPQYKRILKYMLTIPIIMILSILTLIIISSVFTTQDRIYQQYQSHETINYYPRFSLLCIDFNQTKDSNINSLNNLNSNNTLSDNSLANSMTNSLSNSYNNNSTTNSTNIINETNQQSHYIDLFDVKYIKVTFLYPCLYGIIVDILSLIFQYIAIHLNNFENHRTSTIYMNRLILKIFSFQFITIFTSLYYYSFISKLKSNILYLHMVVTIFSLMTVGQWYSTFMDIFIPAIYYRITLYHMKTSIYKINHNIYSIKEKIEFSNINYDSTSTSNMNMNINLKSNLNENNNKNENENTSHHNYSSNNNNNNNIINNSINKNVEKRMKLLEQARSECWEEAIMMKYSTFNDYTNLIIQISFILLFSIIFPLTPFLALINNILLIRFNAIKICYFRQRPIATKVGSIGVW